MKVRPIDDESAAGVNRATAATERLRYDTLDKLFECLVRLKSETQVQPCIMQTWRVKFDNEHLLRLSCRFSRQMLMRLLGESESQLVRQRF